MLRSFHRWLGVALAGWLGLVCISGLLLLWEDEYYRWRYPQLTEAQQQAQPSAAAIGGIVDGSTAELTLLGMPTSGVNAYHAYYADGTEALLHPETGEIVDRWGALDTLPAFLFELHAHLLLDTLGLTIAGALGIAACLNVAAGFLLWLRKRSALRLSQFFPSDLSRRRLLRAHAAQGALLQLLLLTMLLTGVGMAFSQQAYALLNTAFGARGDLRPAEHRLSTEAAGTNWAAALTSIRTAFPDGTLRFLTPPRARGEPVVARLRNAGELHPNGRSYLVVHPLTGEALQKIDATRTGLGPSLGNAIYPLHAAKTGWPGHRLLFAVATLSLLYIALSGTVLALTRPRRSAAARRTGKAQAAGT